MLIELRVKNFLSFKDEVAFSMVANKDKTLEKNLFNINDYSLKKSVAIFGPNGSGKTNLITALALIKFLVINSKGFKKEEVFMEKPFKLDSNYGVNKPIEFNIKFLKNKNVYDYLIKISTKEVGEYKFIIEEERLIKNGTVLFDFYEKDREKSEYCPDLKTKIEERVASKNKNKLIVSYIREKNFDQFDEFYDWFKNNLEVFVTGFNIETVNIAEDLENDDFRLEILKILSNFSFSKISKMKVVKEKIDPSKLIEEIKKEDVFSERFNKKLLETAMKQEYARQIKVYHLNNLNKDVEFSLRNEESSGTNRFIELLVYILKAVKANKVLVIDEIEQNLHPILLKKLYEIINSNTNGIQLVATTHAYPLLLYVNDEESEIFRRDQIYFTRLLKDESTQLYSLINIGGVRKDLKIFKAYFDGRLEAFPNFENE